MSTKHNRTPNKLNRKLTFYTWCLLVSSTWVGANPWQSTQHSTKHILASVKLIPAAWLRVIQSAKSSCDFLKSHYLTESSTSSLCRAAFSAMLQGSEGINASQLQLLPEERERESERACVCVCGDVLLCFSRVKVHPLVRKHFQMLLDIKK